MATGVLVFTGTPPFTVNFSIKNLATGDVTAESITTGSYEWNINFPDYILSSVGPHLISVESFKDASLCPPLPSDIGTASYWVDVAETAAIVPFERREHYCVGDVLHFQLEGNAPWRVEYVLIFLYSRTTY
jgi:nucleoporin POM152